MTNSRNKGSSFERDIARELELLTGVSFKRDLEQVRAAEHGDLIASDPAFPFLIECKRYAKGNACLPAWKAQAVTAAKAQGLIPAVVFKFDRLPIRVAVPMQALGHNYDGWAEIDLPALAYLASELMAARAEGAAV
jgi:Holliday junction resolvase